MLSAEVCQYAKMDPIASIPLLYVFLTDKGDKAGVHPYPIEDRKQIGVDIKTVEFGWPIGSRSVDRWAMDFTKYVRA
jgi:hypothetical protein